MRECSRLRSLSRAGISLGTTVEYPQSTTAQRPEHCATHNERCRDQRTQHLGQVFATHNERRRGQRPKPMLGIIHVPLHHKRPAFALSSACLVRQQAEKHCQGQGFRCPVFVCAWSPSFHLVFQKNNNTNIRYFFRRLKMISRYSKN